MSIDLTDRPEHWNRVQQLFADALARDGNERRAFVADACGSDVALRRELEELLAASDDAVLFMEKPPRALVPGGESDSRFPERIGGYQILGMIATGGMGKVLAARQDSPRRIVAIKVMRWGIGSRTAERRF